MKYKFTKEELQSAVKISLSSAQVCRELGIRPVGGNYKTLKVKYKEFEIDTSHFTGKAWNVGTRYKQVKNSIDIKDILSNKVSYLSSGKLKYRLIKEGYKEEKCEKCGLSEWMGKNIPLELNHINGDNLDNNIDNLEILCCNCHGQTSNWRGRKKGVSNRNDTRLSNYNLRDSTLPRYDCVVKIEKDLPKCLNCGNECKRKDLIYCNATCYREHNKKINNIPKVPELLETFKNHKSFTQVGKHFNVSDNAVRKWCESYGIIEMVKNL
jgi:hypothetical protein